MWYKLTKIYNSEQLLALAPEVPDYTARHNWFMNAEIKRGTKPVWRNVRKTFVGAYFHWKNLEMERISNNWLVHKQHKIRYSTFDTLKQIKFLENKFRCNIYSLLVSWSAYNTIETVWTWGAPVHLLVICKSKTLVWNSFLI